MLVDAGHCDVKELCPGLTLIIHRVVLSAVKCQVDVPLVGDVQSICGRVHHPRVCDNQSSAVSSGRELIYATELYIDRRRNCLPRAAIWCMRLEEFRNGVVRPLVAPPVEGD